MSDVRTVAGEFVLAIADNDEAKTMAILREVAAGEIGGVGLLVQLASIAEECMRMVAGDEWRDVLNHALLAVSMEGAGDDRTTELG